MIKKLYGAPGACSLAAHIALHEAGLTFNYVPVDLRTRQTADGRNLADLNSKGYVPVLELEDGQILTCLLYTSPSPRDKRQSRMPSSA